VGLLINTLYIFGMLEKSPICVGLFKVVPVSIVKIRSLRVCSCPYTLYAYGWSVVYMYTIDIRVYMCECVRESECVCVFVRRYTYPLVRGSYDQ